MVWLFHAAGGRPPIGGTPSFSRVHDYDSTDGGDDGGGRGRWGLAGALWLHHGGGAMVAWTTLRGIMVVLWGVLGHPSGIVRLENGLTSISNSRKSNYRHNPSNPILLIRLKQINPIYPILLSLHPSKHGQRMWTEFPQVARRGSCSSGSTRDQDGRVDLPWAKATLEPDGRVG